MNSKDLRAIEHVERLVNIGVDSLKVEGRTKSFYYVARTAQVYRRAINDAMTKQSFNPVLLNELDKLTNRGYTEGFLRRHTHDSYQNYDSGNSVSTLQQLVGEITDFDQQTKLATIEVKNKFLPGDSLEVMQPDGNHQISVDCIFDMHDEKIDAAKGSGHSVKISIPNLTSGEDSILLRNLPEGRDTRNPFEQASSLAVEVK